VLTCPQLQPDPANYGPGSAGSGGTSFDNGGGPGSAGLYLAANNGKTGVLAANAFEGNTSIKISVLAISNQTLTITGATGTYTVTAESNALGAPVSYAYPATVTISPPLVVTAPPVKGVQELKGKVTPVTVNPTVTTPNRTINDAVTSGTDLSSATANFTNADLGLPISGSYLGVNAFSGVSPTIATVNSTTDVTLSAPASTNASGVVVTIGNDNFAPANVTGDFDFQASQCQANLQIAGVFSPTSVILSGQNAGIANSAIALEANPSALTLTATFPSIGAGWADKGGTGGSQPTTSISFSNAKFDKFVLLENAYTYAGGIATGNDYNTTKATMGLAANGMVTCSIAQLQGISVGTGPDAALLGDSPLKVCDGGTLSSVTPAQALDNLINLELNPQASVYGSDGSSLAAIWEISAGPQGNTVI